jgi:hypothetical protein
MLAVPSVPAQNQLVPLPWLRNTLSHTPLHTVPVFRKHAVDTALAAELTPQELTEVCLPVQQVIADMQATQLLLLCWCILASQLIVYALDRYEEEP